ncbi:MAG: haloacid dehalogenase type II [Bacteroidota bacterium]
MPLSLPTSIKSIVFDAYGTLFDVQTLDAFLKEHYGDKSQPINAIWRQKQLQYTWLRSLMGRYEPFSNVTTDALRYACQVQGEVLSASLEQQLVQRYYTLQAFPDTLSSLGKLASSVQLAVLSNANPEMLEQAVHHNGLHPFLTHILSVDSIQMYKPIPAVYDLATQAFGLEKEEIVFVSSNTWDVAGAKSAGLRVIWLNRYNGNLEELGIEPDWQISSLEEIILT